MNPSTNGDNGDRDERGRFARGNPGGTGNPHAAKVARLRSALLNAVTEQDIMDIAGNSSHRPGPGGCEIVSVMRPVDRRVKREGFLAKIACCCASAPAGRPIAGAGAVNRTL